MEISAATIKFWRAHLASMVSPCTFPPPSLGLPMHTFHLAILRTVKHCHIRL